MKKKVLVVIGGLAILAGRSLFAMEHGDMHGHGGHEGHEGHEPAKEAPAEKGFSKMVKTDGITVAFYIETSKAHMKAMEKMKHGETKPGDKHMEEMMKFSHHISVSFINDATKAGMEVKEGKIKVTTPGKKEETKDLHWMAGMKHYGALFNLGEKRKYDIEVTFKAGEKAGSARLEYEAK